ncbi:sulfotransferase family 2 domain-containing protein [Trichothermofontia sp.]
MSKNVITESSLSHDQRRAAFAAQYPQEFKQAQELRNTKTPNGFSYKPFDDHRCIFFHIPKAAGISVAKSLFGSLGGGHVTAQRVVIIFSQHEFESYFKFTFVRNPWDRLLSAYNYIKAGGLLNVDRKWAVENIVPYKTFESFVLKGLTRSVESRYKTLHLRVRESYKRFWKQIVAPMDERTATAEF